MKQEDVPDDFSIQQQDGIDEEKRLVQSRADLLAKATAITAQVATLHLKEKEEVDLRIQRMFARKLKVEPGSDAENTDPEAGKKLVSTEKVNKKVVVVQCAGTTCKGSPCRRLLRPTQLKPQYCCYHLPVSFVVDEPAGFVSSKTSEWVSFASKLRQ